MLPEALAQSRSIPPALIAMASAIKVARDAIALYEGVRIIGSEFTGEPGSIRSMIASTDNRGAPLTMERIQEMNNFELSNSISLDDPFDASRIPTDMPGDEAAAMVVNAQREEDAGRLAFSELERRFNQGPSSVQQEIIDAMQLRQNATEQDEQNTRNEQRAEAFNRTTRDAFAAIGDLGRAFFPRGRKSSDSALVSAERHEYDYCCNDRLKIFSALPFANSDGGTYIQAILHAIQRWLNNAIEGEEDGQGNIVSFKQEDLAAIGIAQPEDLMEQLNLTHGANESGFANSAQFFTFGNWVDSRFFRKGIAQIRKLVRTVRSANVTEILRLTTGQTPQELLVNLIENLEYKTLANAVRSFILVDMDVDGAANVLDQNAANDGAQGFLFDIIPNPEADQ